MASRLTEMGLGEESSVNQREDSDFNFAELAKQNQMRLTSEKKYLDLERKITKQSGLAKLQEQLKDKNISDNKKKEIEKRIEEEKAEIRKKAIRATLAYERTSYNDANVSEKAEMLKKNQEALEERKKALKEEMMDEIAMSDGTAEAEAAIRKKYAEEEKAIDDDIMAHRKKQNDLNSGDGMQTVKKFREDMKSAWDGMGDNGALVTLTQMTNIMKDFSMDDVLGEIDKAKAAAEDDLEIKKGEYKELEKQIADAAADPNTDPEKLADLQAELIKKKTEVGAAERHAAQLQALDGLGKSMKKLGDSISASYNKAFEEAESILTSYSAHVEARLQGSEKSYKDAMNKISTNLSISPFVKTQNVIEAMRDAVDQGIVYNLEQRAFLSQISDKIANTFDAFDANLLRLIRLQQADSTAARLGMEAALTRFFNNMFEDSSYLNGGRSQEVAGMLIDASSTMTKEASAEFEYVVQKWMGSLTSVGISNDAVNSIVESINLLATGDVNELSSKTEMQNLFAMAAAEAGLDFSKILLNGLTADDTNKLLESTVIYLKSIAESSENMVTRSAYGDIYGMQMSDFAAISNLRSSDISTISGNNLSYQGMNTELNSQFNQLFFRTTLPEMLANTYNNAVFGVAQDMVNNPMTYAMTKMLNFMEDQQINMNIPFINAMGFGLDLNANVQDLMRLGLGVGQAFSLVGNIVGGLTSGGGLNLDAWGFEETTKRGSGVGFSSGTTLGETSSSTYVTTQSSEDMKNSALNTATDDAEETGEITNKNHKTEFTFDDFYKATIGDSASDFIITKDINITSVKDQTSIGSNFLSVQDNASLVKLTSLANTVNATDSNYLNVHDISAEGSLSSLNSLFIEGGDLHTSIDAIITALGSDLSTSIGANVESLASKSSTFFGEDTIAGVVTAIGALNTSVALGNIETAIGTTNSRLGTSEGKSLLGELTSLNTTLGYFAVNGTSAATINDSIGNVKTVLTGWDLSTNLLSKKWNGADYLAVKDANSSGVSDMKTTMGTISADVGELKTDVDALYGLKNAKTDFLSVHDSSSYGKLESLGGVVSAKKDGSYLSVKDFSLKESMNSLLEVKTGKESSSSLRTTLQNSYIPVALTSETKGKSVGDVNKEFLENVIKTVLSNAFIKIKSAAGSDIIPVDTELISTKQGMTKIDSTSKKSEADFGGYRPGNITWN